MEKYQIQLTKLEGSKAGKNVQASSHRACDRKAAMEFHIDRDVRREYELNESLFSLTGNVILADMKTTRELAAKFNAKQDPSKPEKFIKAGHLYAMGLIDEILHYVVALYREDVQPDVFETALDRLENNLGSDKTDSLLIAFNEKFPPRAVYKGEKVVLEYLKSKEGSDSFQRTGSELSVEETLLLSLANLNPAFKPFKFMFDDKDLSKSTVYPDAIEELKELFKELPPFGPDGMNLWDFLRSPAIACPDDLLGQLEYMRKHWGMLLGKFMSRLLLAFDIYNEENKPGWMGPGPSHVLSFAGLDEYERFSPDQEWMPKTVLMAKSTLVWLFQLSQKYKREITRLDQIPDEELDELARRGFTGLWLIGVWERSNASKTIKQWTGNPEAAASAYSLHDYDIAGELGGWGALCNLRDRCMQRGIKLGSDMVPNHTGIDSRWMIEHPDRFLQLPYPPFPTYNYNCGNLSGRDDITVQIEEHYFDRSDAAVVFKRIDNNTGHTRYIYHGNDGTSMPWNDTAQIDFLNPEAREAVIQTIIGVCRQFSIVRFDAAMTLAKRHIQRLWYPAPGTGGAIASRAEHSISTEEFNRRIPNEFWREVVDRCAVEAPNTLLLAEAFWMMEGYFVRTLGMHRVYNSAFMNMLKNEENSKYRATIKNTMEFDPEILKRFVNFMNNPDEETAVAQFGKGDKYFGICTLLVTMPGLPMFGHGQIEGFEEKYGMEYRRAYRDEVPDGYMLDRHEREIFPLMKRRYLFSGSSDFRLYDLYCEGGSVNENVFAYTNRVGDERALIFYNNSYYETSGWIRVSDPAIPYGGGKRRDNLCDALSIHGENHYFTLMREQKSNLWFIRSSKAICENGFFVGLKGYETQVFIDIYEVEDDAKGRWARLNNDMNGGGFPNADAAIKDIFLGDLYYRFMEIFKPEYIGNLCELGSKKTDLLKLVGEFINTAVLFLSGSNWDPFIVNDKKGKVINFKPVSIDKVIKEFDTFINDVSKVKQAVKKSSAGKNAESPLYAGISKYFNNNKVDGENNNLLNAIILGYGVLSLLRSLLDHTGTTGKTIGKLAADLGLTHWDLSRKLHGVLCQYGASDFEALRIIDIMKVFLGKTQPETAYNYAYDFAAYKQGQWTASEQAVLIIEENYLDEDFRRILGINVFDDIMWFNKEGFENALFYSSLFFMLESTVPIPIEERIDRIAEIYAVLIKAEAQSGYRVDSLLDYLTPKQADGKVRKLKQGTKAAEKDIAEPKTKTGFKKKVEKQTKPTAKKPAEKKKGQGKKTETAKPAAKKKTVKKPEVKKKSTLKKSDAKKAVKKSVGKKTATAKKASKKPVAKKKTAKKPASNKKKTNTKKTKGKK